jgi:hypothetical protein
MLLLASSPPPRGRSNAKFWQTMSMYWLWTRIMDPCNHMVMALGSCVTWPLDGSNNQQKYCTNDVFLRRYSWEISSSITHPNLLICNEHMKLVITSNYNYKFVMQQGWINLGHSDKPCKGWWSLKERGNCCIWEYLSSIRSPNSTPIGLFADHLKWLGVRESRGLWS